MLKRLYQFCLERLAVLERELFQESRESDDVLKLEGKRAFRELARAFAFLTAGIKYIFFQLLLALTELAVLVVLSPKDGYELLTHHLGASLPSDLEAKLPSLPKVRIYEEYERKHKKARWFSLGTFSAAVAAVVVVSLVVNLSLPLAPSVLGATYTFTQTNWGGGSTGNNAIHPTNQSAWSQYSSASSEIVAVNGGEDLEIASSTASVVKTSEGDFTGGTFATTTTTGSGSVKLSKALHINEYTIGALSNIAVTASTVTANSNGTWTIAFGVTNLSRIFKNDKFVDSASKAWKVLSVSDSADKIIVVDSEGNTPAVLAPATGSGTVGRWYASISAWEAGRNADITATGRNAIERGLPYYDGAADTAVVTIDGWTTDATHYIEIYVPLSERHRGKWDNGKYRLEAVNNDQSIYINEEYVRLDGLQIKHTANGGASSPHTIQIGSNNINSDIRISNNIFDGINVSSSIQAYAIDIYTANTANIRVWNNVFYNYNTGGTGTDRAMYLPGEGTAYVYNNTIYGIETGIARSGTGTMVAKNNIYQSNGIGGADGYTGTFTSSDYNISDLASDAPGANSKNATTTPFVDVSSSDFHLEFRDGTANPAMNAGADLSADANLAFNTDIDGSSRLEGGTWDVGADDVGATLVMTHSIGTASRDFPSPQAWESARDQYLTTRHVYKITNQIGTFQAGEWVADNCTTPTKQGFFVSGKANDIYLSLDNFSGGSFAASAVVTGCTTNATATISAVLTTLGTIEKGEAYKDSTFTAGVTIDGSTTDASHYMWLTAEPGSRHTGVAGTGAKISYTGSDAGAHVADPYTIVEWMEVGMNNLNWQQGIYGTYDSSYSTIRNNIIYGTNRDPDSYGISFANVLSKIFNNIVYDVNGIIANTGSGNNNYFYNNTAYNNTKGFVVNGGPPNWPTLLKNNISASSTTSYSAINTGLWDNSSSNNISSDATAPGTSSLTSKSVSDVKFVSTASDFIDLHILDGSVAKDAGADLSATFTGDVDGTSRQGGTWDVGADEWFSSSPVYNTSGTYESPTIDFGGPVNFGALSWNPTSTQPISGSLKFAVAAKNTDSGWQASDYVDLNQEAYPAGVTVEEWSIQQNAVNATTCNTTNRICNSLASWEDAADGTGARDLVTENKIVVAKIEGSWTSPDTTAVTIDGWTTDATHYIKIYTTPEARHNGKWDNTKYRIETNGDAFGVTGADHIRVEGLQVDPSISTSGSNRDGMYLNSATLKFAQFNNNIIRLSVSGSGNRGILINNVDASAVVNIFNNIVYFSGSSTGIIAYVGAQNILYNNTINGMTTGINGGANTIAKNNIVQNVSDGFVGGFNSASDYNISNLASDAPSPSYRNGLATTVTFVDAANGDFRLASGDTAAKNAGADLSADANLAVKTDILGRTRPTGAGAVDIGAHEYGATGGSVPASLDGNRYLRYKAYLSTSDSAFSPQMDDLTVNYIYYPTSSVYLTSSPYNSNDATNILGKIAWTATTTSGTNIKIQVRSAPNSGGVPGVWSQWCGPTTCNDSESDSDNFTASANNVDLPSNHPLKNGGDDQWLQYKVKMVSNGAFTPTFGDITLTYVVNAPPVLQNVTASQQTSDGKVAIAYEVKDVDTATGTVTRNAITPSFSYSTDGGNNWTAITSGYLSWSDLNNKTVNGSTFTPYSALWDAKSQLNGTYATNTKIMVSATDNEGANNSASLASSVFTLDVKNPVAAVTVDGTKDGLAGAIAISLSEDSSSQMMVSNDSGFAGASWTATSTSLTWTFASGEPTRVYAKFKDAYQNEVQVAPDAPPTPLNATIQDTSNLALSEFREFISWDVSGAGDFASYKVYRSTDGTNYSLLSTINNSATNYLQDGSSGAWLSNGTTYYYRITAQDSSGNVSRYSSAVSDIPDGQGGTDVTPPTITSVAVSSIGPAQATVTWTTDELSNSTVYYSTDSSYSSSKSVASMVTAHSVTLTGLTPNTSYNFRARSTDPLGNISSYATGTPFTTTQGAVISGVAVVSASGNSATVVWNTDANSDSWVIYSANSDLSGSQTAGTSTPVGGSGPNYEHRVALSGLTTNAKYYFKVRSVDGSSNAAEDNNSGNYYTFSTAQDVSPPIISNVAAGLTSQTSAAISWTTNELSDSQVIYGLDQSSLTSQTAVNSTMTINHSMILSGLTAGATYYYKVVSADSSANSTQSAVYNFSTTAQDLLVVTRYTPDVERDRTAPLVSEVEISDIKENSAIVSWSTDENSSSFVEYGRTELFGKTVGNFEEIRRHKVVLDGLLESTEYYLRAKSHDAWGNIGTSKTLVFRTLKKKPVEEEAARQAEAIIKKAGEQKDVAQLTKEVEQMLADLSLRVSPPKITGAEPQVELTSSFAVISWSTDRPANSIVAYAMEKDYLPSADESYKISVGSAEEQVTEHRVVLSDLAPGTVYHFQARSKGLIGAAGRSKDYSFKTGEEASISGVEIKEVTKDSATMLWRTNIPATTALEYGVSLDYGMRQSDDGYNASHIALLRNLRPGTFYHFKIGGADRNGNVVSSPDLTFTTESLPSLLNVKIDAVKEREMTITWYTDVLSDSTVEYTNLKTDKTEAFSDKQMVRNHTVTITGLERDTPYKFRTASRDEKGNEVKSSEYNLQTTRDREPPQITNVQTQSAVSGKDRVQTIVSWRTSEPASSRVSYQEGVVKKPELERTSPLDNDLKLNHVIVLTDLKPGAAYRLKIESVDASNNAAQSRDLTILTPQRKETVIDLIIKNFQDVFRWTEKIK